jgi:nicotinamidase-related amidase
MTDPDPTPAAPARPLFRPPEGAATALVVVDIQQRLAPAMDEAALGRVRRAARILAETARQKGWRVIATEQYPQGLGPTLPDIASEVAAAGGEAPLSKVAFSACGADGFKSRMSGASAAVIIGMEAHVCVLETALDLVREGVRVFVPWDGVASRREEDRTTALELLRQAGAAVTSAETLAFQALGRAGTPEFKAISARVR